ncbi:MAG TPA: hypothetical protein VF690_12410 [Hymenobacter sp.]|jgi:hypothetical protein
MEERDYTITKVGWLTQLQGRITSTESIHASHRALLAFLKTHGLTVRTVLEEDEPLTDDSCLMRSDLTEKGFLLYQKAEQQWLRGQDRGKSPTDVTVFERELAKL